MYTYSVVRTMYEVIRRRGLSLIWPSLTWPITPTGLLVLVDVSDRHHYTGKSVGGMTESLNTWPVLEERMQDKYSQIFGAELFNIIS
jgi:hypothetical protein